MPTPDLPEVKEISKEIVPLRDANGDTGTEERIEYSDGTKFAHGKFEDGPSKGLEWIKGDGGRVEGQAKPIESFGLGGLKLSSVEGGRWGQIVASSQNPDKPKAGDTWLHAKASAENQPARAHASEELTGERPDAVVDPQNDRRKIVIDDQNRVIYSLETTGSGTITRVTTYHEGYSVTTGRKVTQKPDPQTGEVGPVESFWEEWRADEAAPHESTGLSQANPRGEISDLKLRGFSRDLAVYPQEQDQLPLHLQLHGEWSDRTAPKPNEEA